jgi:hypothetical protein
MLFKQRLFFVIIIIRVMILNNYYTKFYKIYIPIVIDYLKGNLLFNKESCRRCGSQLESIVICSTCSEISLWKCSNCNNKEEYLHLHNNNEINITNQFLSITTKKRI